MNVIQNYLSVEGVEFKFLGFISPIRSPWYMILLSVCVCVFFLQCMAKLWRWMESLKLKERTVSTVAIVNLTNSLYSNLLVYRTIICNFFTFPKYLCYKTCISHKIFCFWASAQHIFTTNKRMCVHKTDEVRFSSKEWKLGPAMKIKHCERFDIEVFLCFKILMPNVMAENFLTVKIPNSMISSTQLQEHSS